MGKCSFLITKGKKKGSKCGIYTSKIHDKKYLCAAHYKLVNEEIPDSESEESEKKIKKHSSGSKSNKKEIKKEIKKEPKKEVKKEESEELDDLEESKEEQEVKEIKKEIHVENKKKYKPYKPSDDDLINKDLDELIDEYDENEKDKPESYLVLDKIDLLIEKINRIESFLMSNVTRSSRQKPIKKLDEPEIEVFN